MAPETNTTNIDNEPAAVDKETLTASDEAAVLTPDEQAVLLHKEYYEEYLVLLDMYRCSTRYIHMQKYDDEKTRKKHLQNFKKLYEKYRDCLEKKCKKNTGYGFDHETIMQNYFKNDTPS